MAKLTITHNEWYPVLELDKDSIFEQTEVPDELVERYRAALSEWEAVQAELRKLDKYDDESE